MVNGWGGESLATFFDFIKQTTQEWVSSLTSI